MEKPAHDKCRHQCESGCAIHGDPRPEICTHFRCAWLDNDTWGEELRPDQCGIVYTWQQKIEPGKHIYFGVARSPYAKWTVANSKLLSHLKRTGSIVYVLYQEGQEREVSVYADRQRHPWFEPEKFLRFAEATATPETKARIGSLRQFERARQ